MALYLVMHGVNVTLLPLLWELPYLLVMSLFLFVGRLGIFPAGRGLASFERKILQLKKIGKYISTLCIV
jgi:hypothetical protein